jgi:hypothetical protein
MSKALRAGLVDLAARALLAIGEPNDAAVCPKLPPTLTPGRLAQLLDGERAEPVSAACG